MVIGEVDGGGPSGARPSVSVILPTFNEQPAIRDCLDSLLRQDWAFDELLVVDGESTDATREIVATIAAGDPRVRLLENPRRSAAAAMNVGIREARGELLVRVDAHTLYAPDYVRRSVEALDPDIDDVGGPMRPVGTTRFGRAVAAVTSSRIGMGSAAFHWTESRRVVDTVYLGCYRTDRLRALGGYDEDELQWGAEDQELNFRLRKAGGTIVCDPNIRSAYFPRETRSALWRQYRNYGICKMSTLAKHGGLPTLRPLAPAALVAGVSSGLVASVVTGRLRYSVPGACWLGSILAAALRMGRSPGVDPHRAALALGICHWSYGIGVWAGAWRLLTGKPFDRRPAHRR